MCSAVGCWEDYIQEIALEEGLDQAEIHVEDAEEDVFSCSCRITIEDGDRTVNLYVKYSNTNSNYVKESIAYFHNELSFYQNFIGYYKKIRGDGIEFHAFPKCYKTSRTENPFIFMEDIGRQGYTPIQKDRDVNIEEARIVVQQLGVMHGISYVMKDQNPNEFKRLVETLVEPLFDDRLRGSCGVVFLHSFHDAVKLAQHTLPPNSIYLEKLSDFTLNIFDKMTGMVNEEDEYKVLNHGDLWKGNIHFLYGGNRAKKVCFLDFQGCRVSSPVHDLMFFLLVSLDKRTRDVHKDELIRAYHTSVCLTVRGLGSDPLRVFPFAALQDQLARHGKFALATALAGLPLYLNEGTGTGERDFNSESLQAADAVVYSVKEASARKSMKCKNKIMEIIIDMVDYGCL